MWVYNAQATAGNASEANVATSDYFLGASGFFGVGDLIYVATNDPGFHLLAVTAVTEGTTVTTSTLV